MREKIAFISNRLSHQRKEIMTQEAEDAVKALSASVLPLEALLYSNSCHPFEFFVLLTQIAGNVSCLDTSDVLPFFKAYNHHDLQGTFKDVLDYIHSVLNQIQEGYYILPFDLKERLYTLSFKSNYVDKKMIFGARASKGMTTSDVTGWIQSAVICSEQYVPSVRDKRILGASRKIISSDEDLHLLAPRDVVLFSVDYDPAFIDGESVLCMFNVADTLNKRPEEIVFYLPKQQ
jgi:type VI secretion system protein ImpJ